MAGNAAGKSDSSGLKILILPLVISRYTLRIKARNSYRFKEEKEIKRLGPILWPEVAGLARNRPEKVSQRNNYRGKRERAEERREKVRVPK